MKKVLLLNLGLLCLLSTGCASMAKFTPEQLNSIKELSDQLTKVAQDNNVTAIAEVDLEPIEFYLKQSAGMRGIRTRIIMTANPAAK